MDFLEQFIDKDFIIGSMILLYALSVWYTFAQTRECLNLVYKLIKIFDKNADAHNNFKNETDKSISQLEQEVTELKIKLKQLDNNERVS